MDAQIIEFFGAAPWALALYEPVEQALYALSPTVERKVQRSHFMMAASLPVFHCRTGGQRIGRSVVW